MAMFEDMGIKTEGLVGKDGQVDLEKVDAAYAQVRQKIKERGGNDLPEDATLADLYKAYRASDPARNPQSGKNTGTGNGGTGSTLVGPKNGTQKAPEGKSPPLTRRESKPPAGSQSQMSTTSRYSRPSNTSTGTILNGAPVDANDTGTINQIKAAQKESAATDAIAAAETRRDAQLQAQLNNRRREQDRLFGQLAADERLDQYKAARDARIAQNYQRRADSRYDARKLSNADDWKNLGREGSNRRDYTKKAEGETDEQFQAAVKERNDRVAALKDRIAQMTDTTLLKKGEKAEWVKGHNDDQGNWVAGRYKVTDAKGNEVNADEVAGRKTTGVGDDGLTYANEAYANAPKRMQYAKEVQKLMESAGGNITDAQIEGANGMLDKWQGESDARVANQQVQHKLRDTEQMWRLRDKYGMQDSTFTNDDVKAYHESQQKAARTEALRGMQVAPGITSSGKPEDNITAAENMQKFSQGYQKLLAAGFNPQETFKRAMDNADNKKAYMEGLGTIAQDDPDRADKMDQLRRRFIMNQAMKDHGINYIGGQDGTPGGQLSTHDIIRDDNGTAIGTMDSGKTLGQAMSANLPGRSIFANDRNGNAVVDTANREVAKAEATAAVPPAQVQTPSATGGVSEADKAKIAQGVAQWTDTLKAKKKPEELQQAAKGGDALRPRRRR